MLHYSIFRIVFYFNPMLCYSVFRLYFMSIQYYIIQFSELYVISIQSFIIQLSELYFISIQCYVIQFSELYVILILKCSTEGPIWTDHVEPVSFWISVQDPSGLCVPAQIGRGGRIGNHWSAEPPERRCWVVVVFWRASNLSDKGWPPAELLPRQPFG